MNPTNAVEAYGTFGYNTYTLEELNAARVCLSAALKEPMRRKETDLICRKLAVVRHYSDLICKKDN